MNYQTICNLIGQKNGLQARELFQRLASQSLPAAVDVIVALQGDRLDRLVTVAELSKRFRAPILLTGNDDLTGPGYRADEAKDPLLSEWVASFVKSGVPKNLIIVDDQAFNTKEQAGRVCELAKSKNWRTLAVVTSPYHLLRSFLSFVRATRQRNFSSRIFMQAADLPWDQPPAGKTQTALKLLVIELNKIDKYRADIASYGEGLAFLLTYAKLDR